MKNLIEYDLDITFIFEKEQFDVLNIIEKENDSCLKFEFDICGFHSEYQYFLIDEITFSDVESIKKGIGSIKLETDFMLNSVLCDLISKFLTVNNQYITKIGSDGKSILKLKFDNVFINWS